MTTEAMLIWGVTLVICAAIVVPAFTRFHRTESHNRGERQEAIALGFDQPRAQHPMIDLDRCIGCGSCIAACPEGGVLGLVSGKAAIINGLRCIGHGLCAQACPVEAVVIGMGNLSLRDDLPRLSENYETSVPGLYIAGELGGLALIKNAISQGQQVAKAMMEDGAAKIPGVEEDLIIVGAGPAGLSAALAAISAGLNPLVLDQEDAGGTILHYPRKKLVLTQPVDIPIYGRLDRSEYTKEELLEIWTEVIERAQVRLQRGVAVSDICKKDGTFELTSKTKTYNAHKVLLAMGRRGTPRKLRVPGENLGKVAYRLIDAALYNDQDLLVVGGGDSAVEAAIALSRQAGNRVSLSYRKPKFGRVKKKNAESLVKAEAAGLEVLTNSQVLEITPDKVILDHKGQTIERPNQYVFIFAGGVPPFALLKKAGIAFGEAEEA